MLPDIPVGCQSNIPDSIHVCHMHSNISIWRGNRNVDIFFMQLKKSEQGERIL